MKDQVERLQHIVDSESRRIVGLMSGTSLDGLDIALCRVSGHGRDTRLELEQFTTIDYQPALVADIRSIFSTDFVSLEKVCLLNETIGTLHGAMVKEQLDHWGVSTADVDLIASHGQTIYHAPLSQHQQSDYSNATLQIGDGDHVARASGIITISDFRQRHLAAGGEGAPLVVYGDSLLYSDTVEDRILLNIGLIANFTYLPNTASGQLPMCSDIGPGNTMMDAFIQKNFPGLRFDMDGEIAASGSVNEHLLKELSGHSFFSAVFPRTTGPEVFNLSYLDDCLKRSATTEISDADIMATLNAFTASSIASCLEDIISLPEQTAVYVSGGGARNRLLIQAIQQSLASVAIMSSATLGIDPDAKEAILFAVLANECLAGSAADAVPIAGMPVTSMGKICFPI